MKYPEVLGNFLPFICKVFVRQRQINPAHPPIPPNSGPQNEEIHYHTFTRAGAVLSTEKADINILSAWKYDKMPANLHTIILSLYYIIILY
jgi:hypothetical protein